MPQQKALQVEQPFGTFDYIESELGIGLVCAVGTDYKPISESLSVILGSHGYTTKVVRISDFIEKLTDYPLLDDPEIERISRANRSRGWLR